MMRNDSWQNIETKPSPWKAMFHVNVCVKNDWIETPSEMAEPEVTYSIIEPSLYSTMKSWLD